MYLWGKKVARGILFPCAFLIFMVPAGVFTQVTFNLQFIITALVGTIAPLFGIGIQAVGTTLTANDGSFNFQVVEGCSGIRSLVAMMMLTAIYVHLTQIRLWKKLTIFSASILFALIGNTGRILSIVLVAKYVSKTFAEGTFHEVSGYISFPFALGAMIAFDWFLGKFAETLPVPNAEPGSSPEGGAKETPLTDAAPPSSANENKRPEYDY
jgi:exosortase